MQNLSEQVINEIRAQKLEDEIQPGYVNRIINSLDEEERSATEISRIANVSGAMARAVLTIAEGIKDSPVKNKHMRFRLTERIEDKKENKQENIKPATKRSGDSSKKLAEIIPSIISILHARPQTISSLADELEVAQDTCQMIVKKLEDEGAVTQDLSTEWEEPVYMLDNEGYKKYLDRTSKEALAKAESSSEPAKEELKAKDVVSNENSEVPETITSPTEHIENMILELLKKEEMKVSSMVKMTSTAITRVDIEEALNNMMNKGLISCDNPSKKHPIYFLSSKDNANKENTSKSKAKVDSQKESTSKKQSKEAQSNNDEKAASESSEALSEPSTTAAKKDDEKMTLLPKSEGDNSFVSILSSDGLSSYPDVAALQLVLEDVLASATESKASQVRRAIDVIIKEKDKVKKAVSNLNNTINELL